MSASRRAEIATQAIERFLLDSSTGAFLTFPENIAPHLVLAFHFVSEKSEVDSEYEYSDWFFYGALASGQLNEKQNRERYPKHWSPLREIIDTLKELEDLPGSDGLKVLCRPFYWPIGNNQWEVIYRAQLAQIYKSQNECPKKSGAGNFTVIGNANWAIIIYGLECNNQCGLAPDGSANINEMPLKELANGLLPIPLHTSPLT